jgi:hypothetical protein
MEKINLKRLEELESWDRETRRAFCKEHFGYFMAWYFPQYLKNEFAPFHYDFMQDLLDLESQEINELAWIAFRESAKSSFAKLFLVYLICYRKAMYINVDAFDKTNAERILFDVTVHLQRNQRIIHDFGELYTTDRKKQEITQKRVDNFITNPIREPEYYPGIRVEAHSVGTSVRGRIHDNMRPDFLILDDFETREIVRSEKKIRNVADHIQEFKGGMSSESFRVLYLGNYISTFGNVQSIIDKAEKDPKMRCRIIPIKDPAVIDDTVGEPTWPERFVLTDGS